MTSIPLILIVFLSFVTTALVSVGSLFFFRGRFRRLWHEILQLRKEIQSLHKEIIRVRKRIVIDQSSDHLRLPPLLPSEDGEEIILYNFFAQKRTGFFVEVGAYNGVDLSNTYFLESLGWHGILIEPDPSLHAQCVRARPYSKVLNVAASDKSGKLQFTTAVGKEWLSFSGENKEREQRVLAEGGVLSKQDVPCMTLNTILADCQEPIDFISIDVEGHELSVLAGLDFERFRPTVILLEQGRGQQDRIIDEFLSKKGYQRAFRLGSNSFYVGRAEQGVFGW